MFDHIRRRPWRNIHYMVAGLLEIADGLSAVCSLGTYKSDICMRYLVWASIKSHNN